MKQFVTFEGIDGSGKSTIVQRTYDRLKKEGHKVKLTVEPTNTDIGLYVQHCIKTHADPFLTAFVFIADRIQHSQEICKWINQGYLVLCDRYADSTYAYQGAQLEEHLKEPIKWLQELSNDRICQPDVTLLFDIDPKSALKRIQHRDELIPFEEIEFLTKVRKNYLKLSKEKIVKVIDATQSIHDLVDQCVKEILG